MGPDRSDGDVPDAAKQDTDGDGTGCDNMTALIISFPGLDAADASQPRPDGVAADNAVDVADGGAAHKRVGGAAVAPVRRRRRRRRPFFHVVVVLLLLLLLLLWWSQHLAECIAWRNGGESRCRVWGA